MEAAFALIFGVLAGTVLLGVVVLILGFLVIGLVSPIGALITSMSGHRRPQSRDARTAPRHIGRPVLHH